MEELNKRKRVYDKLKVIGILFLVICVISTAVIRKEQSVILLFVTIVFGIIGGILLYKAEKGIKSISMEFKDTYIRQEIKKLLPNATYDPIRGIGGNEIEKSNLIKLHNRYNSEDLIEGTYKDVGYKFSDVHVVDVRSSGKTTTRVTTFKGRVYRFEFNKTFRSNVFLLQPGQFRPFSGYEKIKMESSEFNSEFKIYSDNEHDAFYILTPHFMEKLLELDRIYYDKIGFSFLNNQLYIAVDSRTDSFDVLESGDITIKHVDDAVKELNRLMEFIDYLQLNNSMFKKN